MTIGPDTVWFVGSGSYGETIKIATRDLVDLETKLRVIAGFCYAASKDGTAQELLKAVNALQILKSTHSPQPEPTINDRFDKVVKEHMDGVTRSFDSNYRVRFVGIRAANNAMRLPEAAYETFSVYANKDHEIFKGYMNGKFETGEDAEEWADMLLRTAGFFRCDVAAEVIE